MYRISSKRAGILFAGVLLFCMTACGKQADKDDEAEQETAIEGTAEPESRIEESAAGNGEADDNTIAETDDEEANRSETDDVIMVYVSEDIEYSDEVIPVQYVDDLSLLDDMKYTNSTYVYQDGNVYYRRYHEDSYEEAALWGDYRPILETKKEIVCINSDGRETELFVDDGYGDIYLIHDRFYMTGLIFHEDNEVSPVSTGLYSVDMQGNDRIDYGDGSIFAIDRARNIIILRMWETNHIHYYAMNVETGEKTPIDMGDGFTDVEVYQDGWLYYTTYDGFEDTVRRLCAVSLEGEKREIIALTSYVNQQNYIFKESILQLKVDGDRVYFIFGGYDGTAHVFQGGTLISVKLDGTDYKAVKTERDAFYLSHAGGKTLIYYPRYNYAFRNDSDMEYDMNIWDIDANKCYLTDFPQKILYGYKVQAALACRYDSKVQGALCVWTTYEDDPQTDIYAVPDDSSGIVRIVTDLENCFTKWQGEETDSVKYQDWYYADGFLYFGVEYRIYDEETSVGWRDGYRRLRTEVYRLKIGESAAQMLYSY